MGECYLHFPKRLAIRASQHHHNHHHPRHHHCRGRTHRRRRNHNQLLFRRVLDAGEAIQTTHLDSAR